MLGHRENLLEMYKLWWVGTFETHNYLLTKYSNLATLSVHRAYIQVAHSHMSYFIVHAKNLAFTPM